MANKDNQSKEYRIYIKESKSWVDVNKEFYTNYYRDINAYRKRLDALKTGNADDMQLALLRRELNAASHRPYSSGFYFGELKHHAPDEGAYLQDCTFVGVVRERLSGGRILFECRNRIREGDRVELLSPDSLGLSFVAGNIRNESGLPEPAAARPSEIYSMDCGCPAAPGDLLRMRTAE